MNIKVLEWNIWTKEDPNNIAGQIKKVNPDIICLQEIIQNSPQNLDVAKYLADELNYNYFFVAGDTWDNKDYKTAQGNAIFSRFPISKTSQKHLQVARHNPPDPYNEGRVYIEIEVDIDGQIITVGTTHLSYSPYFKINEQRKKEIDNLINIIKTKKNNYILAADLNSDPRSYTIKEISKYLKNAAPNLEQKTWTTKPSIDHYGDFKEPGFNWRIDHIFTTPDIKLLNTQILDTKYSDHLPILSQFEI